MIWATISSWSCFCWLYRASPPSVAKNVINLILILTIWSCPCVESSLVLLKVSVCYDKCVLLAKLLLAFALLHFVLQGQICLLLQVFLDFLRRPTRPSRANIHKRCPSHYRNEILKCKSRKSRNTWSNRQIWPWSTKWSRAKANKSFAKRTHLS